MRPFKTALLLRRAIALAVVVLALVGACGRLHAQPAAGTDIEDQFLSALERGEMATAIAAIRTASPAAVNRRLDLGDTMLGLAVKLNDLQLVLALLGRGADPNLADAAGWAPLAVAVSANSVDVARALVARGARLDISVPGGLGSIAALAVQAGDAEMRRALNLGLFDESEAGAALRRALAEADEGAALAAIGAGATGQAIDGEGTPLLVVAALWGRVPVVEGLLGAGATVSSAAPNGVTPLMAAVAGGHVDVVRLLLERGASPTAQAGGTVSALDVARRVDNPAVFTLVAQAAARQSAAVGARLAVEAAEAGNTQLLRDLLAAGASPGILNGDPNAPLPSPLAAAAFRGRSETVAFLLERGVSLSASDSQGNTALMAAALGGHVDIVELLLNRGATQLSTNRQGLTALGVALAANQTAVVRLLQLRALQPSPADLRLILAEDNGPLLRDLLARQAQPALAAESRQFRITPAQSLLTAAAAAGAARVVDVLLDAGAAPNSADAWSRNQTTPLMAAAANGHEAIVRRLLAAGANPLWRDSNGRTAREMLPAGLRRALDQPLIQAEQRRALELSRFLRSFGYDTAQTNVWNSAKEQHLSEFLSTYAARDESRLDAALARADRDFWRVCNAGGSSIWLATRQERNASGGAANAGRVGETQGWFEVRAGQCWVYGRRQEGGWQSLYAMRNDQPVTRPRATDPRGCIHQRDAFRHAQDRDSEAACRGQGLRWVQFYRLLPEGENARTGMITLR